ncbi:MAG: hypothetical protein CMF62_02230 [Magnetococcales bacterium]|nr:hypothetical protein [Magnetococcales bacterium]|tara:strand:- start:4729 stop:4980 length:252 start_codon:yes stop_codon:yes gene_type:complete
MNVDRFIKFQHDIIKYCKNRSFSLEKESNFLRKATILYTSLKLSEEDLQVAIIENDQKEIIQINNEIDEINSSFDLLFKKIEI